MDHALSATVIAIIVGAGIIGIGLLILWIYAIVQIVQSDFKSEQDKLIWVLVVILLGFIGAIVYFIVGSKQRIQRT